MAQVDYFLKIEGVDGESQDSGEYKGWIEVLTFSYGGMNNTTSGGGTGKLNASVSDVSFMMSYNRASAAIFQACLTGKKYPKATFACRKVGGDKKPVEYLKIILTDVQIGSYISTGGSGNIVPVDSVLLNFTKIEVDYKLQNEKGNFETAGKASYDAKQNKPG